MLMSQFQSREQITRCLFLFRNEKYNPAVHSSEAFAAGKYRQYKDVAPCISDELIISEIVVSLSSIFSNELMVRPVYSLNYFILIVQRIESLYYQSKMCDNKPNNNNKPVGSNSRSTFQKHV